jgi:hypothetical protein
LSRFSQKIIPIATKNRRKICGTSCAILNVTEEKKEKEAKKGCCAIIDVTERKGALNYGEQIKKRVFG